MRSVAVVLCICTSAMWALAGSAGAGQSRLKLLESDGLVWTMSDGSRWAVTDNTTGMRLFDGQGPTLLSWQVPTAQIAAACKAQTGQVWAIGGGMVAIQCYYSVDPGAARVVIYDIAAKTFRPVVGDEATAADLGSRITAVGSQWIAYSVGHHEARDTPELLNWHDGRVASPTKSEYSYDDLDSVNPTRKLCAGVKRPIAYRYPFALVAGGDIGSPRVKLSHCGHGSIKLSKSIVNPQLASNDVVWRAHGYAYAQPLRSGTTRRWKVPGVKTDEGSAVEAGRFLLVNRIPRAFSIGYRTYAVRVR